MRSVGALIVHIWLVLHEQPAHARSNDMRRVEISAHGMPIHETSRKVSMVRREATAAQSPEPEAAEDDVIDETALAIQPEAATEQPEAATGKEATTSIASIEAQNQDEPPGLRPTVDHSSALDPKSTDELGAAQHPNRSDLVTPELTELDEAAIEVAAEVAVREESALESSGLASVEKVREESAREDRQGLNAAVVFVLAAPLLCAAAIFGSSLSDPPEGPTSSGAEAGRSRADSESSDEDPRQVTESH